MYKRAYLPNRYHKLTKFVYLVAIGGIGVGNNYKGIKLTI